MSRTHKIVPIDQIKPHPRNVRTHSKKQIRQIATISEDGFEYAGTSYTSLSKIAKKITGAHWSGPRFFGLLAAADRPVEGRSND